ncbi:hypothetical protein FNV43_RR06590 [Rhamnella rubrinervis]|uniref:Metallo-beta-lactamase domain-containing protein n=1 Tax=Rhamnella rubrinervis TaxID=2594499 RepID=A0A8K0HDP5_9ROSA|nr:hypothetical protein FNV43_RR06590 [Rhamnella rubrinervis]
MHVPLREMSSLSSFCDFFGRREAGIRVLLFGLPILLPVSILSSAKYHSAALQFHFPEVGSLSPFRRIFQACLQSDSARGYNGADIPGDQSEIIFIGTGTSEGIPRVSCLTNPLEKCEVCSKAAEPGNRNKRLSTSILTCYPTSTGKCNILVDAGNFHVPKNVNSSLLFQSFLLNSVYFADSFTTALSDGFQPMASCISVRIRTIDMVIITHSHADAIGGLDSWLDEQCPAICSNLCPRDYEKTHYYLVDTSVIVPGAAVSDLQFNIIDEDPFTVHGLKITPLPVWHGSGLFSLGFHFADISHISGVSEIPEELIHSLRIDPDSGCFTPRSVFFNTFWTSEADEGMMHLMDHEKVNNYLLKIDGDRGCCT